MAFESFLNGSSLYLQMAFGWRLVGVVFAEQTWISFDAAE